MTMLIRTGGLAALILVLGALSAGGCGSAGMMAPAAVTSDAPVANQVSALEAEQALEVTRFDGATAGDDRCARLCFHLDKICELSDRICALSDAHPEAAATESCGRSRQTCEDTKNRLPPECACEPAASP